MKRRTLITISFVLVSCFAFAESSKTIDSLETKLKKAKGTEKVEALSQISLLYLNESPKKAFDAGYKALYYATFMNSADLLAKS